MNFLQTRRRFFVVAGMAALPGCTALDGNGDDESDTDSTATGRSSTDDAGTRTPTPTPSFDCSLRHVILDDDRDHQIRDSYQFGELSTRAQQYFEGAHENPGTYYEVEDTDETAPEYEYTDVVTKYEITYEGQVYVLGTFSGEGCQVES